MNRKDLFALTVILILAVMLCVSVACAPTQNQGSLSGDNEQNGGQISSGDNQTGDSDDQTQNPSFPSGDTGSGNIGSGDSDTDEIENGDNNSDIGEEKPEVKYPSTIAEMTIEQKKILTDYLDEKYKNDIAKSTGIIGAKAENTNAIGYTLEEDRAEGFFATIGADGKYFYKFETGAEIDIYKFFEAIDDKEDLSEFAKFTFENYSISSVLLIPLTENEYSANAENAYKKTIDKFTLENFSKAGTIFTAMRKGAVVAHDGMYNPYELTAITTDKERISVDQLFIVPKGNLNDYVERDVDVEYRDHRRKTLIFEISENTIYIDDLYTYKVEIDGLKYGLYDGEATVMGYTADLGKDVIIPDSVTYNDHTYSVTEIGSNAFEICKNMQSIVIPASVSKISLGAFASSNLTSIEIPSGVTSIGVDAFRNCSNLTIYCQAESQPSGWNSSWNKKDYYSNIVSVVWDCKNNEVAEDGNIYYVADTGIRYALKDGVATVVGQSTSIGGAIVISRKVTYKGKTYSVTSIGDSAFAFCSSLTSIEIPSGVTSIGAYAFSDCSRLTSIEIPSGVTSIGVDAFRNCSNLTIYCQAASLPSGWSNYWNYSNRPVVWGYKG